MSAANRMPDMSGRLIDDGRYKLVESLGSGAYGVVYSAVDLGACDSPLDATRDYPPRVAIKVLMKDGMSSTAKMRVRREVLAHSMMSNHSNVITMRDAFDDKEYVYIILDYCPGGDLFTQITDHKRYFRQDELLKSVFLQILDAVQACHRKRVYHRDLKPENILTTADGSQAWITDFGLATSNVFSETFHCGSSYYMSPECIGKETDYAPYGNSANDVWSLGVILINMVTCRSPWHKALVVDECFRDFLVHEHYLQEMLPISSAANTLFRRIFAYEPIERITVSELRQAIIEIDTFFMSDEDIARSGISVRVAASYCGAHVEPVKRVRNVPKAATVGRADVAESLPPRTPANLFGSSASRVATGAAFIIGALSEDDVSAFDSLSEPELSEGSSASESSIPDTPSTSACDLQLAVPHLNLEFPESGQSKVAQAGALRVVNVAVEEDLK